MKRFEVPEEARPYVAALNDLISTGVSASHTLEASPLVDLPVVVDVTGPQAASPVRAAAFIKALKALLENRVLEGKDYETAELLFGLGEHAGSAARRRYELVAKLHDAQGPGVVKD